MMELALALSLQDQDNENFDDDDDDDVDDEDDEDDGDDVDLEDDTDAPLPSQRFDSLVQENQPLIGRGLFVISFLAPLLFKSSCNVEEGRCLYMSSFSLLIS